MHITLTSCANLLYSIRYWNRHSRYTSVRPLIEIIKLFFIQLICAEFSWKRPQPITNNRVKNTFRRRSDHDQNTYVICIINLFYKKIGKKLARAWKRVDCKHFYSSFCKGVPIPHRHIPYIVYLIVDNLHFNANSVKDILLKFTLNVFN